MSETLLLPIDEPEPGFRRNVGIMLLNSQGKVFVGQRLDTPEAWQMPQGGIDEGEDAGQAALRELHEEVGTSAAEIILETPGWLTYVFPAEMVAQLWRGQWRGQAQKWFVMRFTGADGDIRIDGEHPEFAAWRWVDRIELPHLIVPFKRPVYEAVLAYVEPRLSGVGF